MASWRKLLQKMLDDPDPQSYDYDDCTRVLSKLGFQYVKPQGGGTSHRKWKYKKSDGSAVVVELVGNRGPLKRYLVRDMLKQLRDNGLLPTAPDSDDDALDA